MKSGSRKIVGVRKFSPAKPVILCDITVSGEDSSFQLSNGAISHNCDFEPESRDRLKDWLRERFGDTNCMSVSTSGGTHIKGAIQDLARIAGVPPQEVFKITTQINYNVNNDEENTLDWILENNEVVSEWLNDHPKIKDWVTKMQEVKRSIGKHASAYIISSVPIDQYIPVVLGKNKEQLTGFPESSAVKSLNKVGLIKFDLLGLENLTVIRDTLELIQERHGVEIDWDTVDVNDPKVYSLVRRGFNGGVFQIDSPLAAMVIATIQPTSFEDLSALNALIRPACLQVKSHHAYRDHKQGRFDRAKFPVWKDLEGKISEFSYNLLDSTYGTCIYQEQVMAIISEFCDVSLDETNQMRKIIGIPANKKRPEHWDYINEQKEKWMKHGAELVGEEVAEQWWETAIGSLSYSFNRCLTGDNVVCLADGTYETVENLYKRDEPFLVVGYDEETRLPFENLCEEVVISGEKDVFEVNLENGSKIKCSKEHKLLTAKGYVEVQHLEGDDEILFDENSMLKSTKVRSIRRVGKEQTYDLVTTGIDEERGHNFLANGIVTSNSHSISYAMVAFRQLWLKTYYPKEFYCALLRTTVAASENLGRSKLMKFAIEARQLGVPIESPHINKSRAKLDYVGDTIYVGFGQVKGIGDKAAKNIAENGPYESFEDFLDRAKVNKTVIQALIYTDSFRDFGTRQELLEKYWRGLLPKKRQDEEVEIPTDFEILKKEHSLLTTVLSVENPLELPYGYISVTRALDTGKNRVCKIKGILEKVSYHTSRNGNTYARLIVNDLENSAIVLVWKNYHKKLKSFEKGDIMLLTVKHLDGETFSLVNFNE